MGVEVAHHHHIAVSVAEEVVEVRSVASRTGARRRDVDVIDEQVAGVEMKLDRLDFDDLVVDEEWRDVDGRKFDVVTYEEGKAAPAVICRTIAPDHGMVAEEG